jgi:hypothetical protein
MADLVGDKSLSAIEVFLDFFFCPFGLDFFVGDAVEWMGNGDSREFPYPNASLSEDIPKLEECSLGALFEVFDGPFVKVVLVYEP